MRILYAALLVVLPVWVSAQIINGRVYQAGTDSVVANASVYYSSTSTGTLTNSEGRFMLQSRAVQVPLIVSCVGYYSAEVVNYQMGKEIAIYLKPKQQQLPDVVVQGESMPRAEKVRIFTEHFIGTSEFAQNCTIINIDDVVLLYSKSKQMLTATCSTPLIIKNPELGYYITYYLDNYTSTPQYTIFTGNYMFKELPDAKGDRGVAKNREKAYWGSRMQFIRALWHNTLNLAGFKLYTLSVPPKAISYTDEELTQLFKLRSTIPQPPIRTVGQSVYYNFNPEDMVLDSLGQKFIKLNTNVLITHSTNPAKYTRLAKTVRSAFIDSTGFSTTGLLWGGVMSHQRMGDALPFEYQSKAEQKILRKALAEDTKKQGLNKPLAVMPVAGKQPEAIAMPPKVADSPKMKLFKSIVLIRNSKMDSSIVVKKWQQAIRYKVYGTTGNGENDQWLSRNIGRFFDRIAEATKLKIIQTQNDVDANFQIILGDAANHTNVVHQQAVEQLSGGQSAGLYFTTGDKRFTKNIVQVNPEPGDPVLTIWGYTRSVLLRALGFFNPLGTYPQSMFYNGANSWVPEHGIDAFDGAIIKSLYRPNVTSGMTEQQLDAVFKGEIL